MTASFGQAPAAGAQPSVVADLRSGARLGLLCPTGGYEAQAEPDDLVFVPWSDGIGCAPDRAAIVPVFERSEDLPRTSLSNGVSAAEVAVRVEGAHALSELAGVHPDYVLLDPVMTDVRDPRSDGAAVLAAFAGLTAHRAADLGRISSCISGGDDDGRVQPALEALRSAGGTAVGAFPVTCDGARGLLVVADHAPGELGSELREAMELLAGAIVRALDHVQLVEALRLRAETDALTRVGNRSAFDDALAVLDESGPRTDHLAVLLADLDGFKAINDRFGHLVGDQVLVETADAMARTLRADDRLFRIGGDEFAVLVSRVDEHSAFDLAARICDAVRSVLDDFGAPLSIGVAVLGESEPATACVQRADRSLYEAKRSLPGTAILAET